MVFRLENIHVQAGSRTWIIRELNFWGFMQVTNVTGCHCHWNTLDGFTFLVYRVCRICVHCIAEREIRVIVSSFRTLSRLFDR